MERTPKKLGFLQKSNQTSEIKPVMMKLFGNTISSNLSSFPSMPLLGHSRMVSELSEVDSSMCALMKKVGFLTEKFGKKNDQRYQ
jgi:hypothetical protein